MEVRPAFLAAIATWGLALSCDGASEPEDSPYAWALPGGISPPSDPLDNPTTKAKVELGGRLFFDGRLSADGSYSCASCHEPAKAFSDGRAVAVGLYGDALPRGAPGLANAGYLRYYTWANTRLTSLEDQALVPMLVKRPPELDIANRVDEVMSRLSADDGLARLFRIAFPGDADPVVIANVVRALSSYERTLVSAQSPYDRFLAGDVAALSPSATHGRDLFFSDRLGCGGCHTGRWLTDAAGDSSAADLPFHNTGLYNLGGTGAYPPDNRGLIEFTGTVEDMGRFRTASLRNVALTAPYMHDGSVPTLDAVLDHYAAGGRTIADGPDAGQGSASPFRDPRVVGFSVTADERRDVLAFLDSLTDPAFTSTHQAPPPLEHAP